MDLKNSAVTAFIKNLKSIEDPDYGDFMRRANHYFLELRERLSPLRSDEADHKLAMMHNYLQYNPSWSIEPTLTHLLMDAEALNGLLSAYEPAWEKGIEDAWYTKNQFINK